MMSRKRSMDNDKLLGFVWPVTLGKSNRLWSGALLGAVCSSIILLVGGCSSYSGNMVTKSGSPATYYSPTVTGPTYSTPQQYIIDDSTKTISALNSYGSLSPTSRGLENILINTVYLYNSNTGQYDIPQTYNPPLTGNWGIELPDQAGAFVQMKNNPVAPLAPTDKCPEIKDAQTYLFVSIPAPLTTASNNSFLTWRVNETAYGSVDIKTNGTNIQLSNVQQHTLPSVGGQPLFTSNGTASGQCGWSQFGYTTVIPTAIIVTDPGNPGGSAWTITASATLALGPTGMFIEDNGNTKDRKNGGSSQNANGVPYYNPVLAAGTGAVGFPKPSSAVDTSALTGAQYLGFAYGAGSGSASSSGWTSTAASFGFSSQPASCSSLATKTGTMIYGGDFPNNDPSTSVDGYGNCNLAIDLGTQDSSNNGLYPNAKVYIGSGFAANASKTTYSFPAVAIAGKLGSKYAIFLIGLDSTQPWGIYLLQSN